MDMKHPSEGLSGRDHGDLNTFLGAVLDDYKNETITRGQARSGLAYVIAALDVNNYDEGGSWRRQGRKLIRRNC